ncbi:MAG: HlyD family efflux transporter periplasmic adaptor subunit [Chloroflexota bacterium]
MRKEVPAGEPVVSDPDPAAEIATRLPVTEVRHWLVLLGVALVCAGVLAWLVFGSAAEGVTGRALVVPSDGFLEIGAEVDGYVEEVRVRPGDPVAAGEVVAVVRADDGARAEAVARQDGTIVTVLVREGSLSLEGDAIAMMETDAGDLVVSAFLPAGPAKRITPGMEAGIALDFVPVSADGRLVGVVEAVAPVPASAERVLLVTGGNAALADYFLAAGPVLEVTIRPVTDPATPSGYRWTVGAGPQIELSAGVLAGATVYVTGTSPLARLLR